MILLLTVLVRPVPATFTANTSLAVIAQRLDHLAAAESLRDMAEATLQSTLAADLAGDESEAGSPPAPRYASCLAP